MPFDQLTQRDAHRVLDIARTFDVPGNAEELGAGIVGATNAGEPSGAAAQDVGHLRDRLNIVDRRRATIEADIGREWRFQPRLPLLAFKTFEKRRLLAADVGAGAMMDVEIERPAVNVMLANQPRFVGLIDGSLQPLALANELAADVDVAAVCPHRV